MPIQYIGKVPGFAQRTFTEVRQSQFYPETNTGLWRSPVTQSLIKADLELFHNPVKKPFNINLEFAIAKAYNAFSIPGLVKMLHLNDVFCKDLDIWSKSPGLPWIQHGYKTKGDIKRDPEAVRKVRHFWHRVKAGDDIRPPDCLSYVRSHVCAVGDSKVRAVWGYPATVLFGEAVFALPLLERYKNFPSPFAYGYETAIGGMKKICKRYTAYKHFAGLDFKAFDKNTPRWLIEKAFRILEANINFVEYQDHGVADARRMIRMWHYIKDYFINTTIRTANGCRYRKSSGIASGSYFTQLVGSICNYILCQWMCLEQLGVFAEDIIVQGDDSLMALNGVMSLTKCSELMKSIGMEINMDKSQITTELQTMKFLGYRVGQGIPSKDHNEWLTALLFPERPDYEFAQLQSRALGLYYANMCVDEKFANICAGLVKMKPFDLILSRDFQRKLRFIGISLDAIKTGYLPTSTEFALKMLF